MLFTVYGNTMKFEPNQTNNNDPGKLDKLDENTWQKLSQKCPYKKDLQCSVTDASCKDENCPVLFVLRVRMREGA
jgi:hypothetical protein